MHTRPDPTPTATGQAAAERLRNEARARLNAVEKATDRLRSDLKKLGPPKTGAGAAISTELSSLSDRLRSSVNELRSMATAPVSSMDELQAQAAQVRTIAATARQDLRRSVDRVKSLEPAGELSTALASAPACRVLRREQSSGTPTG
jgi:chromosome segregation ATPase